MRKRIGSRIRMFTVILALALAVTSVSLPPVTAEAAKTVKVRKVQITSPKKSRITLNKGKTLTLKVKVTPKNAKNKKVAIKSSKNKIVKILSKNRIKALKNGNAKVTVTAKDGSKKKAVLQVKVVTPVSKVKLNQSSAAVKVGKTVSLKATVTPSGASNKKVVWTTSDKKIAAVTGKGIVTGVAEGEAKITATAADGSKKKAVCKINVQKSSVPDDPEPGNPDPDKPNPGDPDPEPDNPEPGDPDKPNPGDPDPEPDNPEPGDPDPEPDKPDPVVVTLKKIEASGSFKTVYQEGEKFDPAGMVVTATYSDGTQKQVTEYTVYSEELGPLDQSVEISYKENGITRKTEVSIQVQTTEQLVSLSCRLKKTVIEREGSSFTDDDVEVTAVFEVFENGTATTKQEVISIADCKVSPKIFTLDTTSATISYTYGTRRRTVKVDGFTVKPYRERYTFEDKDSVGTVVRRANETADAVPTEENAADVNLQFEQGLSGQALKMDGTYGLRLDKIAGTASKSYSISMWVKPDSLKNSQALLISTANKFGLQDGLPQTWCAVAGSDAQGGLKLWSYNGSHSVATQSKISVGNNAGWSHIVLVVDGRSMPDGTAVGTLYVNGRKAGSGNVRNDKGPDMKTYLGVTGWCGDGYLAGLVDELVFTNEVLTQEEAEGYYLEQFAKEADKITEVTADKTAISVDYGTTTEDVIQALAEQITLTGTAGESRVPLANTESLWTVEDHTVTSEGTVTAVAKIPVPDGYVFQADGAPSMWQTVHVDVSVKEKGELASIQIAAQPDKTEYIVGDTFEKAGMAVKALYSNGGVLDVTELVQIEGADNALTKEDAEITVKYSDDGIEKTASVAITVKTSEEIMNEISSIRTAYYQFDESLADTVSAQGAAIVKNQPVKAGADDIVADATPEYVDGVSGKAIRFSGNGTHNGLKLDTHITSADYTVSMWLKPETQAAEFAGAFYAWKDDKNYISWYSQFENGFVGMAMNNQRNDTKQVAGMFKTGEWNMVTWVMEGGIGKVYINGNLKETATQHANFFTSFPDAALYLGSGCLWDNSFNGAWDEVSIFGDALTEQQVKGLYLSIASPSGQ